MTDEIRALALTFSFFSRIRITQRIEPKDQQEFQKLFARAVRYIPAFALISGGLLFVIQKALATVISESSSVIITFAIQYYLFNYFHFDGLVDTSEAFLVGRNKEEMLRVMGDTRIGAFGVLAGAFYVFAKLHTYISVLTLRPHLVILSFSLGRIMMVIAASVFTRTAKDRGLGHTFVRSSQAGFFPSVVLLLVILSFYFPQTAVTVLVCLAISLHFVRRLGGFTGDTLGFLCELAELLWLMLHNV